MKGSGGDQVLRPVGGIIDIGRLCCSAYRRSAACQSKFSHSSRKLDIKTYGCTFRDGHASLLAQSPFQRALLHRCWTRRLRHKQPIVKLARHTVNIPFALCTAFREATENSSEPQNSIRKGPFASHLLHVAEKQRNECVLACRLHGICSRKACLLRIMSGGNGSTDAESAEIWAALAVWTQ